MKTISIAGASSKAGKTLLAEQIIRYCAERYSPVYAVKFTTTSDLPTPCPRGAPCTVCDLSEKFRIVRDPAVLLMPGKNTQRLHAAGATETIWVVAKKSQLSNAYAHLLTHFKDEALTVMEGSSVTTLSKPDLLFYVFANHIPPARWKESAAEIMSRSDFVIVNRKSKIPDHPEIKSKTASFSIDLSREAVTERPEVRQRIEQLLSTLMLPT